MTAAKSVYLLCDGPTCVQMTGADGDANNTREARSVARRLGWKRTKDGRDLCPSCDRSDKSDRSGGPE